MDIDADNLVLGGDFNIPDINWERIEPTQTGYCASSGEMLQISDTFTLSQLTRQSKRGKYFLNLFFTTMPDSARNAVVLPGISDHETVLCDMRLEYSKIADTPARHIHRYKRARTSAISQSLEAYHKHYRNQSVCRNCGMSSKLSCFICLICVCLHR